MSVATTGKVVKDVIDGGGLYFSRVAAAGGWVFMSSPPVDASGALAVEAGVPAPYRLSPSAQVRAQTRYIFDRYLQAFGELGITMADVVQVEQYIQRKAHADGYLEVSRGPGLLERRRPGSALMQTGNGFVPEGVVVMPTGIARVPDEGHEKEIFSSSLAYVTNAPELGDSYSEEGPFSEIVTAGPYVFTTLWASDYRTGLHPDARVDQWVWWGDEIRSEARWATDALATKLAVVDSHVGNAVHCTVYLLDIADLYELDLVWREVWPTDPPSRTVVPVTGLGTPRREGVTGHADNATKMEIQFRSIRPGFGADRQVIATGTGQLAHESEGIKAGPLLWISAQMAADRDGPLTAPDAPSQLQYVLDRIQAIAEAGGSSLERLLRVRAYVTDPRDGYAVYAALKQRIPRDPPCVCVTGVPGPLPVEGCTILLDAVAYAP